jgi:hypothetical protein
MMPLKMKRPNTMEVQAPKLPVKFSTAVIMHVFLPNDLTSSLQ